MFLWLVDLHQLPLAEKYHFDGCSDVWPSEATCLPPEVEKYLYGSFVPILVPGLLEQSNDSVSNPLLEKYISSSRQLACLVTIVAMLSFFVIVSRSEF